MKDKVKETVVFNDTHKVFTKETVLFLICILEMILVCFFIFGDLLSSSYFIFTLPLFIICNILIIFMWVNCLFYNLVHPIINREDSIFYGVSFIFLNLFFIIPFSLEHSINDAPAFEVSGISFYYGNIILAFFVLTYFSFRIAKYKYFQLKGFDIHRPIVIAYLSCFFSLLFSQISWYEYIEIGLFVIYPLFILISIIAILCLLIKAFLFQIKLKYKVVGKYNFLVALLIFSTFIFLSPIILFFLFKKSLLNYYANNQVLENQIIIFRNINSLWSIEVSIGFYVGLFVYIVILVIVFYKSDLLFFDLRKLKKEINDK